MKKKTIFKLSVSLTITFILAVFFLIFSHSNPYQNLELKTLDLRFVLRGNQVSSAPILHVDIDDQSLSKLGRWPWPRDYHAKLTDTLVEFGAKQILMDVLFMEKQETKPQEDIEFADSIARGQITYLPFYFLENPGTIPVELKSLLEKDVTLSIEEIAKNLKLDAQKDKELIISAKKFVMDEAIREAVRSSPGMSIEDLFQKLEESKGWFLFSGEESYIRENFQNQLLNRFFIDKFAVGYPLTNWPYKKYYRDICVPIQLYLENIRGSGFINADQDIDGVTRRVPLFIKFEDKILPQLTVAALIEFLGIKEIEATQDSVILKGAKLEAITKDIVIPVDENGSMLVNWQGKWGYSYKHIPYYLVLRLQEVREELRKQLLLQEAKVEGGAAGENTKIEYMKKSVAELEEKISSIVKGKICLVGLTATGTHDLRPVPLQANYPMVGTHSNLINTILTESFIRKKMGGVSIIIFFFTALAIGLSSLIKLWKSLLVAIFYIIGYFLIAFLAFTKWGLWIDMVGPTGIVVFGFTLITSFRHFTEEKEKLWIKQAFSHYLSNEVINELMDDPSRLKLGGERRNLSVLFSDVRGFTSFSEGHQPEEVVAMLNSLLSEQVKVVFKYGGTLDKFVGDELMAFFGAPGIQHIKTHPEIAVRTAVEIQTKLKELAVKWSSEKKEALHIGIGINSGDMVVGNMGSAERMDYTVIGDNVNLGARLCSAARGDEIIISEETYLACHDQVIAEKLEPISVKGKAAPISIYKVIAMK